MTIEVREGTQSDGTTVLPVFFVEDVDTHLILATTTEKVIADKICDMLKSSDDWKKGF